jgi:hypothetical protein
MNSRLIATAAACGLMLVAPAAQSAEVIGSGLWASNAPTTPYSVAGEGFTFSFVLPDTFTAYYQNPNVYLTTAEADFKFSLNGVALPVSISAIPPGACSGQAVGTLCGVDFFPTSVAGGIGLDFTDHTVEFMGIDIGSQGVLKYGTSDYVINIDDRPSLVNGQIPEGYGMITVVPEPAAWMMLLAGFAAVGGVLRAARRRAVAA